MEEKIQNYTTELLKMRDEVDKYMKDKIDNSYKLSKLIQLAKVIKSHLDYNTVAEVESSKEKELLEIIRSIEYQVSQLHNDD